MTIHSITLAVPDALARLRPGAKWTMSDINDYRTLIWNDDTQTKPTQDECNNMYTQIKNEKYMETIRFKRDNLLTQTDKFMTSDYPHLTPEVKQAWVDYRVSLRNFPTTVDLSNPVWPEPPAELNEVILKDEYVFNDPPLVGTTDTSGAELKTRLQTIETQANSAIQILSDFGVSGLMDPIDTSTWPAEATNEVLDARLKPIETGATGARAILDLFGIENLPEFTVDENSTIESRISALESAGRTAQKTLQDFGVDI